MLLLPKCHCGAIGRGPLAYAAEPKGPAAERGLRREVCGQGLLYHVPPFGEYYAPNNPAQCTARAPQCEHPAVPTLIQKPPALLDTLCTLQHSPFGNTQQHHWQQAATNQGQWQTKSSLGPHDLDVA